jgi:hypothetical protein
LNIKVIREKRAGGAGRASSSPARQSGNRLARVCAAICLAALPFALYFAPSNAQTPTPTPVPTATPAPTPTPKPTTRPSNAPATNAQPTAPATTAGTTPDTVTTGTTTTPDTRTNAGANTGAQSQDTPDLGSCITDVYLLGNEPKATPTPTAEPTATPAPNPATTPELPPACKAVSANDGRKREGGLNDIIVVKVYHLKRLLDRANCRATFVKPPCVAKDILLFIDGRPLKGLKPESGAPELEKDGSGTLHYHLLRSVPTGAGGASKEDAEDLREHWADLLGMDLSSGDIGLTRGVSVSVGFDGDAPIQAPRDNFTLVRVRILRLLWWLGTLAVGLFFFWRLARESDLLRDRRPVAWREVNNRLMPQRKSYSLSLSQAAWWFFFVIVAFVFIWLVTGQYDLSTQALILIGIGYATAVGSSVIDQNKRQASASAAATPDNAELTALLQQKESLEAELASEYKALSDPDPAKAAAAQTALDKTKKDYAETLKSIRDKYPNALGWANKGYFTDILSDSAGVNFHRFQIVVWTVVLGFIFIHDVLSRLSMPEFSNTLLSLMGISNGAYLIGKTTEPQVSPTTPTSGAPPTGAPPTGGGQGAGGGQASG